MAEDVEQARSKLETSKTASIHVNDADARRQELASILGRLLAAMDAKAEHDQLVVRMRK